MQSFKFEHRFSLPPVHLVRLLDDLAFRQYLVDNLANVHASERIRFDDTGYERFKTIRVYPKMNLPSWIERAFKDPESYFEMNYRLDKTRMVEKIEGTSHFGKVIGEVVYLPEGLSGTIRRFQGEFSCRFSVIGPAIEKFYLRHMGDMQDMEADLTQKYIASRNVAVMPPQMRKSHV